MTGELDEGFSIATDSPTVDVTATLPIAIGLAAGVAVIGAFLGVSGPEPNVAPLVGVCLLGVGLAAVAARSLGRPLDGLAVGAGLAAAGGVAAGVGIALPLGVDPVATSVGVLLALATAGGAVPGLRGRPPLSGFVVAPAPAVGAAVAVALVDPPGAGGWLGAAIAIAGFVPVSLTFGLVGVAAAVAIRRLRA